MNKLKWERSVSLFSNLVILKGLIFALVIPFGLLILIILWFSEGDLFHSDAIYALYLIGVLLVLTILIIIGIYGGKYSAGFIIDEKGILNYTQRKQAKKNKFINNLLILIGLFSRTPTATGLGLLAESKQEMFIPWNHIKKVRYYPKQYTIVIKGRFAEKVAVFCTKNNYAEVAERIDNIH